MKESLSMVLKYQLSWLVPGGGRTHASGPSVVRFPFLTAEHQHSLLADLKSFLQNTFLFLIVIHLCIIYSSINLNKNQSIIELIQYDTIYLIINVVWLTTGQIKTTLRLPIIVNIPANYPGGGGGCWGGQRSRRLMDSCSPGIGKGRRYFKVSTEVNRDWFKCSVCSRAMAPARQRAPPIAELCVTFWEIARKGQTAQQTWPFCTTPRGGWPLLSRNRCLRSPDRMSPHVRAPPPAHQASHPL